MFKNGFSLAEMLVVMLVLTIVLAASAPMVTKRVSSTATISSNNNTFFATCDTSSDTEEKSVKTSNTNLTPTEGMVLFVSFKNKNTAKNPSLNLNNRGKKKILSESGQEVSESNPAYFPKDAFIEFIFNGTNWIYLKKVVVNNINGNHWYRIYSDGWIEQGGIETGSTNYYGVQLNFNIPFSNTDYCIVENINTLTSGAPFVHETADGQFEKNRTTAYTFITTGYCGNDTDAMIYPYQYQWQACGY